MDLNAFLSLAGWSAPDAFRAANMSRALEFFTRTLGDIYLRKPVRDPSPWLVAKGAAPMRVMELMQCINFSQHVNHQSQLLPGIGLICYRSQLQVSRKQLGNYYTTPGTGSGALAILPEQDIAISVTVKHKTMALESKAADAFASWSPGLPVDGTLYRRGGGTQFFIPDPVYTFEGWPS